MKKTITATLVTLMLFAGCLACQKTANSGGNRVLFGNIYGTITTAETGKPVSDARIYVTDQPVRYLSEQQEGAVSSDQGWIDVPPLESAVRRISSKPDGSYMLNKIPLSRKYVLYTLVIKAGAHDTIVIDQAPVLPGASMALKIDCRMTSTGKAHVIRVFKGHKNVDINYSDQLK